MVTFMLILSTLVVIGVMLLVAIITGAGILALPFAAVVDVIIGVAPFVLVFMILRWLFKKRG